MTNNRLKNKQKILKRDINGSFFKCLQKKSFYLIEKYFLWYCVTESLLNVN